MKKPLPFVLGARAVLAVAIMEPQFPAKSFIKKLILFFIALLSGKHIVWVNTVFIKFYMGMEVVYLGQLHVM